MSEFKDPEITHRWRPAITEQDVRDRGGKMTIEWPSSRIKLPDFIWPIAYFDMLAREQIARTVVERFLGARLIDVEVTSKRPARPPSYWADNPYKAIWIDKCVDMDEERSTYTTHAHAIQQRGFELTGVERYHYVGPHPEADDIPSGERVGPYVHIARTPGRGALVPRAQLEDCDLFRLRQIVPMLMCTDRVADYIKEQGYSNVDLLEYGELC
jgi:hypothetical protein